MLCCPPLLSSTLPLTPRTSSTSSSKVRGDEITSSSRRWRAEDRSRAEGGERPRERIISDLSPILLAHRSHPRPSPHSRSTPATSPETSAHARRRGRAEAQEATRQRCLSCSAACPRPPRLSIRRLPPPAPRHPSPRLRNATAMTSRARRKGKGQKRRTGAREACLYPPRLCLRPSAVRPHPHR